MLEMLKFPCYIRSLKRPYTYDGVVFPEYMGEEFYSLFTTSIPASRNTKHFQRGDMLINEDGVASLFYNCPKNDPLEPILWPPVVWSNTPLGGRFPLQFTEVIRESARQLVPCTENLVGIHIRLGDLSRRTSTTAPCI